MITNAKWALFLMEKGKRINIHDFEKVMYFSLAVNTASNILQHGYLVVANRGRSKMRAENRVKSINNYYPNLPSPPSGLRKMRNTIQYLDEN